MTHAGFTDFATRNLAIPDIPDFLDRRPRAPGADPLPSAKPDDRRTPMADRVEQAGRITGSNLKPDTFLLHARRVEKSKIDADSIKVSWKSADGVYRNNLKQAAEDGGNTKALLKALKRKTGDAGQMDLDLRDEINYAALLNVPVDPEVVPVAANTDAPSDEAARDRDEFDHFEDGKRAGLSGHSLDSCKHDPGTEAQQTWSLGWQEGQKSLLTDGPKAETAEKPAARRGRKVAQDGAAVH
jgi:ribosome modulation factor